ncbi:MAG: hypothetical protein IJ566_04345 [Cardiobacteriaceae bacterium]|nr:hypothetical protein [Cardiobacteriaceae bacterium]
MISKKLPTYIHLSPDENPAGEIIAYDQKHQLKITVDENKNNPTSSYASFYFSSRETLYDFGLSLVWNAVYGNPNEMECLCYLNSDGIINVVNGMRMSVDSARLFIFVDE